VRTTNTIICSVDTTQSSTNRQAEDFGFYKKVRYV
jgi:hypothetical protein